MRALWRKIYSVFKSKNEKYALPGIPSLEANSCRAKRCLSGFGNPNNPERYIRRTDVWQGHHASGLGRNARPKLSIQEYVCLQRGNAIPLDITTFCFTLNLQTAAEHISAAIKLVASHFGAHTTVIPGKTTGRCADAPIIHCCLIVTINPNRGFLQF